MIDYKDEDLGFWLQAFGGVCWIAAFVVGVVGFWKSGFPFVATLFAVVWLAVTSFFLARAGQNETG